MLIFIYKHKYNRSVGKAIMDRKYSILVGLCPEANISIYIFFLSRPE